MFPQSVLATNTMQGLSKGILEKSWLSSGRNRFADAQEGSGRGVLNIFHAGPGWRLVWHRMFPTHQFRLTSVSLVLLEVQPLLKPSLMQFPQPQRSLGSREVETHAQLWGGSRRTLPSWNCVSWDHHQDWVTWQQVPCLQWLLCWHFHSWTLVWERQARSSSRAGLKLALY